MNSVISLGTLEEVGAVKRGHFVLSPKGTRKEMLHTRVYMQMDALRDHPEYFQVFCLELAYLVHARDVDFVLGPSTGGNPIAQLVANYLTIRLNRTVDFILTEKNDLLEQIIPLAAVHDRILEGKRAVIVDDVITTGTAIIELARRINGCRATVDEVLVFLNRKEVDATKLNVPMFQSLIDCPVQHWTAEECRRGGPCAQGIPINIEHGYGAQFLAQQNQAPHAQ